MEARLVLLFNATVILLISFATDHWILFKIRQIPPPSSCDVVVLRQMTWLRCGNVSYALVEQHANLYRQCNDITEGYRRNASRDGQLYARSCYWFVVDFSEKWRILYTDLQTGDTGEIAHIDSTCLLCAVIAVLSQLTAVYRSLQVDKTQHVFRLLSLTAIFYTTSIIITMYIIHMTNIRSPSNKAHAMYYCEAGWSLICACIAVVLAGIGSYIHLMEHRVARERQLSQRRRKQIHNAIMSSCREEVAVAIRAKMTVL